MRVIRLLLTGFLGFLAADGILFHTSFYSRILSPDSSTGVFERFLFVEQDRKLEGPNQVIGIGNSRMGLMPRLANELTPETGYTYGTVAVAGSSPRAWYYMLRDVDPKADRYAAVIIALDNFNDDEVWEHHADRTLDTRMLAERLRYSDLLEYPASFDTWQYRWQAVRGILFRSTELALDFQDFLLHPASRLAYAKQSRRDSHLWFYGYVGPTITMEDVKIDWQHHTLEVGPQRTPAQKELYENQFLRPLPPYTGDHSKYLHSWFGKIYEHYKGSRTRLIFIRLPRGPFVRPDFPPTNPHSSVRELAKLPGVSLMDEHVFDVLEKPSLFQDELHMNQPGLDLFSKLLAREVHKILGPPR